ncbi:MAG TPA: hypothetical protein VGR72_07615 [Candidatus Acidoferrales bacterium]|nr:hypothetical protein [Candidatus Acidoferrales bacterium]
MELIARPRKWLFVFVVGVLLWGGGTALSVTLLNWYLAGRLDSPWSIAVRFVIFMIGGIFFGRFMWTPRPRKLTAGKAAIVRFVLFIGAMLALVYLLWKMR